MTKQLREKHVHFNVYIFEYLYQSFNQCLYHRSRDENHLWKSNNRFVRAGWNYILHVQMYVIFVCQDTNIILHSLIVVNEIATEQIFFFVTLFCFERGTLYSSTADLSKLIGPLQILTCRLQHTNKPSEWACKCFWWNDVHEDSFLHL